MPAPVSNSPRIRLFKSERLEKLTLISPRTFALSWGFMLPLIALVGWINAGRHPDTAAFAGLIAAGVIAWTLFEYVMHRYLFHLESDRPVVKWFVYLIHGNHHASPNDPLRGLMPLPVSVSVGGLVWLACLAVRGASGTWLLLGFMTGYVTYDAVHFACHQWPMRGRIGGLFKRHHMRHHYVDEDANFAISALFWDRIFGTHIRSLKRENTG
ncbi:sterol desaturase family protein [Novosphingobium sp. NRRL B-2648]|jgi:sterol desaturase/sphingolipid hydroxylase (fatty acid hydroxylase superfamily)|nr:fatty acid hydroxylase [Novosphingobium resinovorum]